MKDKLPSLQFYPGDWRKDPGVQSLSFHDRGVWFELLLIMHESEERGKLMLNGQPFPLDALARLLGLDNQNLNQTLTTLLTYGVASREPNSGVIFCRRMVRDENIRKIRVEAGKKGGNPLLLNQNSNQKPTTWDNQIPTPSSSSSSSSSKNKLLLSGKPDVIPFKEIISYLNEKTGKNFSPTNRETQRHIRARWNEGRRLDDFKKVIDSKWLKWGTDPERVEYLRPQTLFGGKMESYLNEGGGNGNGSGPGPVDPVAEIRKIREAREARERAAGTMGSPPEA